MAVVTRKAGAATARDAVPSEPIDPMLTRAGFDESIGTLEAVSGDSAASIYVMCHGIPSAARISDVILDCDDIGTTTTADVGVYSQPVGDDDPVAVDADFFGSAVSLKDGALARSNVTHESGVFEIADVEKPLWEALGLTSDPGVLYDICLTLVGASDGAATISLRTRFIVSM